jgi:hypothetical protein
MELVNARDLDRWAELREAQAQLPQLVRRLISATAVGLTRLSMRAGEGVGLPGWDGVVRAQNPDAHVPGGDSVWEMGVNVDPTAKANGDYRNRTDNPIDVDPSDTTFVFVTPRRWAGKEAWVRRKKEEGIWKAVIAYDADDLETWLERAPGVHAWISAVLGKDPHEAHSIENWWESWSGATNPALPASLLLSGRDVTAKQVRETLDGIARALVLSGDSQEEAIAFLAAVLMGHGTSGAPSQLERTLIVRTPGAWRRLAVSNPPLILLPVFERPDVALGISHGHHVLIPLGPEIAPITGSKLPRLRRFGIEASLIEAGLSAERASALATLGRRSLLSLRRALAKSPELQAPDWSHPEHARDILPAVLAGKWKDSSEGDRAAIAEMAGRPYEEVVQALTRWANASDPPVRRVGDVWMIAAKQDAWTLTARSLTADDLQRLRRVIQNVVGGDDPSLDLPPRERILAPILNKQRPHSGHLIQGLADTIALMASTSEQVHLSSDRRGQDEANAIVHQLLKNANEDKKGRRWITLSHVLPLLVEAAPDVFLRAIDLTLQGDEPVALKLFQDGEDSDAFFSSSAHTQLLWALETLAWSSDHLGRAALLLAKLARLDPGGRLGNRPGDSLHRIMLLARPGTAATLEQRLQVIDQLRRQEPDVAWEIMLLLIPSGHETVTSTSAPTWRDWKPEREAVTYREFFQAIEALVRRALMDAGTNGLRWAGLLRRAEHLSPEMRTLLITEFQKIPPSSLADADRAIVVKALRDIVGRHRRFADAEWAMPAADVQQITDTIPIFEPSSAATKHVWLFAEGALDWFGGPGRDGDREALVSAQAQALDEIIEEIGVGGLLDWSTQFKSTAFSAHQIGWALGRLELDNASQGQLFNALISDNQIHQQVSAAHVAELARARGSEWLPWAEEIIQERGGSWSPAQRAAFLIALPDTPPVWDLAERSDKETDRDYWQGTHHYHLPGGGETCVRAARKLMEHGRPHVAACVLEMYADDIPSGFPLELVADALQQAIRTTPPGYLGNMFTYHVGRQLDRLEKMGFDESRLAALEWTYLPLFRFEGRHSGVLYRALATSPSFFVDILSLAYTGNSEEPGPLSEEQQARARTAHELLDSWRLVPGTRDDGTINLGVLRDWIVEARKLLAESGRLQVGDHRIGQVLRYGPGPQGDEWPDEPIRDLIEELGSDELEDGLAMEVYNSRGVTSRGMTEGGQQERGLASAYRRYATSASSEWARTAALLGRIAESYEHEARKHDAHAELTEDLWG